MAFIDYIDIQRARVRGKDLWDSIFLLLNTKSYSFLAVLRLFFESSIKALTLCIFWMEIINGLFTWVCSNVRWIGMHPLNSVGVILDQAIVMCWLKYSSDFGPPHGKVDPPIIRKKARHFWQGIKSKQEKEKKDALKPPIFHCQTLNSSPDFFFVCVCVVQDKRPKFLSPFPKQETFSNILSLLWFGLIFSEVFCHLWRKVTIHRQGPTSTPNLKAAILMLSWFWLG